MYTALEVARRLRRELGDERIVVKLDTITPREDGAARWTVCVRRKMLTGARGWPVAIKDDATVVAGGPSIIREVAFLDDVVYVLETDDGKYQGLDPNVIREALVRRDSHRRDLARELAEELRRRKERKARARHDDLVQKSLYYRDAFARIADDMGLSGRPDYRKVLTPGRRIAEV